MSDTLTDVELDEKAMLGKTAHYGHEPFEHTMCGMECPKSTPLVVSSQNYIVCADCVEASERGRCPCGVVVLRIE